MAGHRPLSVWVAWVNGNSLGPINNGAERADARDLDAFVDSAWGRSGVTWNGESVLALQITDQSVVELDDHGRPIAASPHAVEVIGDAEDRWPHVTDELLQLRDESLPLRYWLLQRLDAEGDPPDAVFALLPWELLDLAAEMVSTGLRSGGFTGPVVEMRHWLTPAVRGVTGPLEQLDHGLRTGRLDIARTGAVTLLTNLRDVPLTRIPAATRARLGTLVTLLGQADGENRALADTVAARLAGAESAVPADVSSLFALVVPASYAGTEDDVPATQPARLEFDASTTAILGPEVRGRLSRRGAELVVTLTRVAADLPPLSVETGEPDAVAVRLEPSGGSLRARLPWHRPGLPERLIFRIVAG
jgi:hypothetical protein